MGTAPFTQLEIFLAVARRKSFSAAARELGISRSAASQAVSQLERQLDALLLVRTTRSVSLTDAGRGLFESAGPPMAATLAALETAKTKPGETVGDLRLSVPPAALPFLVEPVLPTFCARYPRISVEVSVEDRMVDLVTEGFDAGVRLIEAIDRDMMSVQLTDELRFVVVGSPEYLERRGRPRKPEDLLKHDCITFRSRTTGDLYAWELERRGRSWRVPVRGGLILSSPLLCHAMAAQGLGLAYALESLVLDRIERGELEIVLEAYAPRVPGFFLYYPSCSRNSVPLRCFLEVARETAHRSLRGASA